jgi:hypothetical protein
VLSWPGRGSDCAVQQDRIATASARMRLRAVPAGPAGQQKCQAAAAGFAARGPSLARRRPSAGHDRRGTGRRGRYRVGWSTCSRPRPRCRRPQLPRPAAHGLERFYKARVLTFQSDGPLRVATMSESQLSGELFQHLPYCWLRLRHVWTARETGTHCGRERKLLYFWGAAAKQI